MTSVQTSCVACGAAGSDLVRQVNEYDIICCGACGLRYVPPHQLRHGIDYDALYRPDGAYASHLGESQAQMTGGRSRPVRARRIALRQIARSRPKTLLDVGCGVGAFLHWVKALGIGVWGSDPSCNALEVAERRIGCPLHCGVLGPDTFPGVRFDAICAWEVLEHVAEPAAFLGSIFDRLNPGGQAYLSTPNYESRWMWNDLQRDARSSPPLHVTFWHGAGLQHTMQQAGFRSVRVRPLSVPWTSAVRSDVRFSRALVVAESLLRPSQRRTLLAMAQRPRNAN